VSNTPCITRSNIYHAEGVATLLTSLRLYSISISSTLLRKLFLLVTPIRTPSFETSLTNQFEGRSYSSFLKLPSLTRQTIYRLQYIITYESNNKNLGDIAGREETCLTEQPKDEGCFRFMDLPPPVRRIIYRLLLVNPILGQHESVNRYSDAGTRSQYDLEPAVLRLNRTIYEEASRVLYNENVFYFACVKHCHYTSRWIWRVGEWSWRNTPNWSEEDIRVEGTCALLRYQYERATPLWELPQMKIVKRWRVFVVSEHQNSSLPEFSTRIDWQNASHSLRQFVRTIRRHTLRELTILVLNKRPAAGHPEMKDLLAPLELLTPSNVENPCVRDALPGEFSEFYENTPVEELVIDKTDQSIWQGWSEDFQKSEPLHVESSSEPAIAQEIPAIDYSFAFLKRDLESMTKHTKVEYVFEMWLRLLKYAQAFESRHPFGEISLPVGFEYMGEYKDINSTVYSDDHKRDVIRNKWYKLMEDLPLEHTMVQANRASHEDDMEAFKTQRRIAVEILEPQYQRMVTAWRLFLGFIMQYLSNAHTFFSEDNGLENAIKYLEECVEAFRRDIPVELGVVMRKRARSRMLPDNMYVRDSKMKGLRHAYQKQKIGRLQDMFKSLVDELEEEFHRVRDARKALFDFDILNEPGLDLSQDEEGIYRRIDWEASGWNTVFKVLSHEEKSPVDKGLSATHIYKHYNDIFAI
jgi:hypothetical protein